MVSSHTSFHHGNCFLSQSSIRRRRRRVTSWRRTGGGRFLVKETSQQE